MESIEEKADKINNLLSPKGLRNIEITNSALIKQYLHTAVVVKHSSELHKMIKKIILSDLPPTLNQTFSIVENQTGEESHPFTKGLNNVKRCHGNHSFRLAYLERLLLEKQINLREFKQFKSLLVNKQLTSIKETARKNHDKRITINAKTLKTLKNTRD